MSTLRLTTISNQTGSSSVPSETVINGSAKAWVNFNGTGTVAIRASFNVSSITDNAVGDYTVNLTNAMSDANYSVSAIGDSSGARQNTFARIFSTLSTNLYQLKFADDQSTLIDPVTACSSILR